MENSTSKPAPVVSLVISLSICFAVAFIGSQATMSGLDGWYQILNKPSFTPPAWLFAPVWTILYLLMGFALWLIWRAEASPKRTWALSMFGIQLVLNGLWSWLFFAWHELSLAFWEIVLLDFAILASILIFAKLRTTAAWLLAPYFAWCCFATALTFSIWRMNSEDANQEGAIRMEIGGFPPN